MIKDYAHQAKIVEDTWNERSWNIFGDTGTGKSRMAVKTAERLLAAGGIDAMFIVAPAGAYRNWSDIELPTHLGVAFRQGLWDSKLTPNGRGNLERRMLDRSTAGMPVLVMNIEALSSKRDAYNLAQKFLQTHKVLLINDESTSIRRPDAERTKNFLSLVPLAKAYRNLSGFPSPERPTDLWTQCVALRRPSLFPYSSWYAFRNHFCETEKIQVPVIRKGPNGKPTRVMQEITQIVGTKNADELHELLLNFSTMISKEDCLDLPPKTYQRRFYQMSKEQAKAYAEIKALRFTTISDSLVSVPNAIAQLGKLLAIAAGYLRDDTGTWHSLGNTGLDTALLDCLHEEGGKVVVWSSYTEQIEHIMDLLCKEFGKRSAVAFYGATPQDERASIVQKFQDSRSPLRFIVGNPATGKFSWTLTAAKTCIYVSNSWEVEPRHQSEDRIHRMGQSANKVTYIDLLPSETVAIDVLDALMDKRNVAASILSPEWTSKLYGDTK